MAVPRREGGELVLVTERGWAKRLPLDELQPQGRGGLGTVLLSPAKDTGEVAAAREVHPGEDLMAVTGGGRAVRLKVESIEKTGRSGAPEKVVTLTGGERVAEVTYVAERDRPESAVGDEAEEEAPAPAEEPVVEVEEARDEPEDMPGPAGELDLFG